MSASPNKKRPFLGRKCTQSTYRFAFTRTPTPWPGLQRRWHVVIYINHVEEPRQGDVCWSKRFAGCFKPIAPNMFIIHPTGDVLTPKFREIDSVKFGSPRPTEKINNGTLQATDEPYQVLIYQFQFIINLGRQVLLDISPTQSDLRKSQGSLRCGFAYRSGAVRCTVEFLPFKNRTASHRGFYHLGKPHRTAPQDIKYNRTAQQGSRYLKTAPNRTVGFPISENRTEPHRKISALSKPRRTGSCDFFNL